MALAAPNINKKPKEKFHSDDVRIEQKPDIVVIPRDDGHVVREPEVIEPGDASILDNKDYLDELAFMEQEVVIRLEKSTEKNSATVFPVWVNGKGCELKGQDGKWYEVTYIPVDLEVTTKRKYLEVIIRAKIDTVETDVVENPGTDPDNRVKRFTSAVHSFSIIHDPDPRGIAWVRELRRRAH